MSDFDRAKAAKGMPIEISEERYNDLLEALPPIYRPGFFAMSEPQSHTAQGTPVYYCAAKKRGFHFMVLGTLDEAADAFRNL